MNGDTNYEVNRDMNCDNLKPFLDRIASRSKGADVSEDPSLRQHLSICPSCREAVRSIELWDVPSGKLIRELRDHSDAVYGVAFSPDGTWVAASGRNRSEQKEGKAPAAGEQNYLKVLRAQWVSGPSGPRAAIFRGIHNVLWTIHSYPRRFGGQVQRAVGTDHL